MLRSASVRVFSDGLLAPAFHQNPCYYRIAFASSIATDAGSNLVLEFLPNIIPKVPIMQKLRLE